MLLLIHGARCSYLLSRSGPKPVRTFLRRHDLATHVRWVVGSVFYSRIPKPRPGSALARAVRGIKRSSWRTQFGGVLIPRSTLDSIEVARRRASARTPEDRRLEAELREQDRKRTQLEALRRSMGQGAIGGA